MKDLTILKENEIKNRLIKNVKNDTWAVFKMIAAFEQVSMATALKIVLESHLTLNKGANYVRICNNI